MPTAFILASVTVAGYFDVRWRRIPNWLVVLTIGLSLTWHLVVGGVPGLGSSAAGLLLGTVVLFPLFLLRGMGAGDVKYFGALGAAVTYSNILTVLLVSLSVSGLMAAYQVFRRGALKRTMTNITDLMKRLLHGRLSPHPQVDIESKSTMLVPFTCAVAMATWILFLARTL
jgi:prepilin peptidase CpaA